MPLTYCTPYEWYLVITCKQCGTRQAIHRDLSQGKSKLLRSYKWRCVHCGHEAVYEPSEVERYQHVMPVNVKP